MRLIRSIPEFRRAFIALALVAHLLFATAAAVGPELHHWLHADADHADHECAITLIAGGGCDSAFVASIELAVERPLVAVLIGRGSQIFSTPRVSGILEHAPPRHA